jgi:hypothetical protein
MEIKMWKNIVLHASCMHWNFCLQLWLCRFNSEKV